MAHNNEVRTKLQDILVEYQSLVQDVDRAVSRAMIDGTMSRETLKHSIYKLDRAKLALQKFLTINDTDEED